MAVALGLTAAHSLPDEPGPSHPLATLDQTLGAIACAAVRLRHRWPVHLAVLLIPISLLSNTSGGAAMVAVFTLAVHRPFRYVAWIGGADLALVPLLYWLRPYPDLPYAGVAEFTELFNVSITGWGMFVDSKRMLMRKIRETGHRADVTCGKHHGDPLDNYSPGHQDQRPP
ncbi:hypothetical protein OG609_42505 [Streptomyces sp. NBC_01224]|uniref:hypothetical protein n=1 Tax=Streptomyces sp. NBC_01224 TaxID=2903783 RepID=UPI002E0FC588|nr:hypothetical protein OG609_42505 [Streptomyces sp. NBC_01224]